MTRRRKGKESPKTVRGRARVLPSHHTAYRVRQIIVGLSTRAYLIGYLFFLLLLQHQRQDPPRLAALQILPPFPSVLLLLVIPYLQIHL